MTDLPNTPSELSALLRAIAEKATSLADEQDRVAFVQRPDEIQEAIKEAVSCLYLYGEGHGNHKAAGCLARIVGLLAPEVHRVIVDEGIEAANRVLNSEEV